MSLDYLVNNPPNILTITNHRNHYKLDPAKIVENPLCTLSLRENSRILDYITDFDNRQLDENNTYNVIRERFVDSFERLKSGYFTREDFYYYMIYRASIVQLLSMVYNQDQDFIQYVVNAPIIEDAYLTINNDYLFSRNFKQNTILYRYANNDEYNIINNITPLSINFEHLFDLFQNDPIINEPTISNRLKYLSNEFNDLRILFSDIEIKLTPIEYKFTSSKGKIINLGDYLLTTKGVGGQIGGFFEYDINNEEEWMNNFNNFSITNSDIKYERDFVILQSRPSDKLIDTRTFANINSQYIPIVGISHIIQPEVGVLKYFKAGKLMTFENVKAINPRYTDEELNNFYRQHPSLIPRPKETEINFVGDTSAYGVKVDINLSDEGYESVLDRFFEPMKRYDNNFKLLSGTPEYRKLDTLNKSQIINRMRNIRFNLRNRGKVVNKEQLLNIGHVNILRYIIITLLKQLNILSYFYRQYSNFCVNPLDRNIVNTMYN